MKMLSLRLMVLLLFSLLAFSQNPPEKPNSDSTTVKSAGSGQGPAPAADTSRAQESLQSQVTGQQSGKEKESVNPKTRVHLGGIGVSGGYSHFSGYPAYAPYGPYYYPFGGLYASMLWDPFWGAYAPFYPAGYFGAAQGKGEVRLSADPKNAAVYVDGGYAGTADHLKNIWLEPGAYELRVSAPDRKVFEQRIYVLSGKSVKIDAKLGEPAEPEERK
jgi:hypothetical protein